MLLVVCGAGASHDSSPSHHRVGGLNERPPLANELFQDRDFFVRARLKFSEIRPIVPYLRNPQSGRTIEQELERLQAEAKEHPRRPAQLAAIRYYLQTIIWECESAWVAKHAGVTNYRTLLDQIEHWCGRGTDAACFVTFNYDKMIEDALGDQFSLGFKEIDDYIRCPYKLIKLHGSVNWAREIDSPLQSITQRDGDSLLREIIDRAATLQISDRYHLVSGYPSVKGVNTGLFPAIAIPVEKKTTFECPQNHISALISLLPSVDKLLIVGWRAAEQNFLQLLKDKVPWPIKVMAVNGHSDSSKEPIEKIRRMGVPGEFIMSPAEFTTFIVERQGEQFLRS